LVVSKVDKINGLDMNSLYRVWGERWLIVSTTTRKNGGCDCD
ncbi:hypothetical protein VCHENC02_5034B, partial [Vibrio harveyi]